MNQSGSAAPKESWGRLIRNLLIVMAVIGTTTGAAFVIAARFGWLARPESRLAVFLAGSIAGEWAALGVLGWLLKRQALSLRELGWGRAAKFPAYGLALLVTVVYCAVTAANPRVGPRLLEWSALKGLALAAALTAGVVEETIFRGYVITTLGRMMHRWIIQVVVSGLVFALAHVYGFASPVGYLISMGFTFLLGAALAVVYLVAKRSLAPAMLSHFLIDAVIEPWLLLSFFTG